MSMIYLVGISIAFFLAVLLLTKKNKTGADKILTCWLFLIGIHLLLYYFTSSGISYKYPFLLAVDRPLPLLHGPLLLLYTASLTNQLPPGRSVLMLHFIPAVVCWLYLINFYTLPAERKIFIFQHRGAGFENFMLLNLVAIIISGIVYVAWCLVLLKQHRHNILDQFSDTEKINLRWLQYLIYGIAVIWLFVFVNDEMLFSAVVLYVILMGFFGIKQVGIFTTQQPVTSIQTLPVNTTVDEMPEDRRYSIDNDPQQLQSTAPAATSTLTDKKKYSKSGLTAEMAAILHSKLTLLMVDEKLFTEPELSLAVLAGRLDTLPNYLSQLINEKEGKTFYDYINLLRVEEFKRLVAIPENKKYTLLSLSFDCGFNSKSSFNKNFKKATGQSPSEYLSALNIEVAA